MSNFTGGKKMSTQKPEVQYVKHTDRMDHMDMEEGPGKMGWKHWGLMILCCLPMIAIALLIIVGALGIR
jgi:hypothetical protein